MAHHTKFWQRFTSLLTGWAVVGLLIGVPMASAADGGPTITGQVCMQTTFSGQTQEPIPSADRLNCTAEDIRIAEATKVSPSSCIMGETFDLTATFLVNVTANARYDAGFYFNIGGGANAKLGTCSLSVLTPGLAPALQLDNDFCGDLNAGQFEVTFTIPDVLCQAAPGTNVLKLPNCTAWHSNQGTACTTQTEANPDTKSKCKCDDNFTVPVIVDRQKRKVTYTGLYFYLTHFSRFVRPGSIRVATLGAAAGLRCIAFRAPDGRIVAQLLNSRRSDAEVSLAVAGRTLPLVLPAVSITTASWSPFKS